MTDHHINQLDEASIEGLPTVPSNPQIDHVNVLTSNHNILPQPCPNEQRRHSGARFRDITSTFCTMADNMTPIASPAGLETRTSTNHECDGEQAVFPRRYWNLQLRRIP